MLVSYRPIDPDDVAGSCTRIGGPLQDLTVHVVDRHGEVLPVGIAGELQIGGPGLCMGYLNRPDLTAARFVPDPLSSRPGERLYRSGDLARRCADSGLEYLGRIDQQVKIRGRRIELGEIEIALLNHPAVRQAVVVVRPLAKDDAALVAYYVAADGTSPQASELRDLLARTLPSYMVPAVFVTLDALPMNASGKVDRGALPEPERQVDAAETVAPRTPAERTLAEVWQELLGLPRVSVHDDFFELGGHSLLATRLISRLRHRLGIELSARVVFYSPTLEAMAHEIEAIQAARGEAQAPLPPIPVLPAGRRPRLSFAQERLWLIDRMRPGSAAYNSFLPVALDGELDLRALERALGEIVRRHDVLRTRYAEEGGGPVQVVAPPGAAGDWTLPLADLSGLPDGARAAEVERLTGALALQPFDLERGPLYHAVLLKLGERRHGLLQNLHHTICDGWSLGVLAREMGALYRAFAAGRPSPLPPLAVQYGDYAEWQRERLGQAYAAQLAYWRRTFGATPPVLDLPADRPRPALLTDRGLFQPFTVEPAVLAGLTALAGRHGTSLFVVLLSAFHALLHRYSGALRISVGTAVANRPRIELEGLIGFFVNTVVLSGDLAGDPAFRTLVEREHETTLGAFEHQDIPFERLVAELVKDRDPGRQPLFQAMLVLQNNEIGGLDLPGVTVSGLEA
ncbi:MAG TPA: condensation domain-containing protein, partial [Thermoanaerobaculia bacterium]